MNGFIKDFYVGFLNLDTGKAGYDVFTDNTEAEARQSFRACYRHHRYKILCCVPIREYNELGEKVIVE